MNEYRAEGDFVLTEADVKVEATLLDTFLWYLGLTTNTQNAYLLTLLSAARATVERLSGWYPQPRTVQAYYAEWVGRHALPFGPVRSVTTVKAGGETLTTDDFALRGVAEKTLYADTTDGLEITYATGIAEGADLPPLAKLAILKEALTQYEVRSNIAVGTISSRIEGSTREMCRALKPKG